MQEGNGYTSIRVLRSTRELLRQVQQEKETADQTLRRILQGMKEEACSPQR